jgi:hypothetical protein
MAGPLLGRWGVTPSEISTSMELERLRLENRHFTLMVCIIPVLNAVADLWVSV